MEMADDRSKKACFYILKTPSKDKVLCQLVNQYYEQGRKVFILVDSQQYAESIDRLLWTFKQASFIPHEIVCDSDVAVEAPVVISMVESNIDNAQILVIAKDIDQRNMEFLESFEVIVDFAEKYDELLLQKSRDRFKLIKKLGFKMYTVDDVVK